MRRRLKWSSRRTSDQNEKPPGYHPKGASSEISFAVWIGAMAIPNDGLPRPNRGARRRGA